MRHRPYIRRMLNKRMLKRFLELRIPPLFLLALTMSALWLIPPYGQTISPAQIATGVSIIAAGATFVIIGVIAFRSAGTTIDPTQPEKTTVLAHRGIYAITRNPMYVGFTFILLGFALLINTWLAALIAVPAFMAYLHFFQILPEERILEKRFGEAFVSYKAAVKRWL